MKKKIPKATHVGELPIGDTILSCAVLEDGTRILSGGDFLKALNRPWKGQYKRTKMPTFLVAKNLKPFIPNELMNVLELIEYVTPKGGGTRSGYRAESLPMVCEVYLKAKDKKVTTVAQEKTVIASNIVMRALAHVGIIALVDEATGFQDTRVKDALEKILNQFLLDEAKKYKVTFPLELYKEWFRLNNWEWREENAQKRPSVLGTWTNKYIYERMAPNLLERLELKNPRTESGNRKHKHFQLLTDDIGEPKLREFFGGHLALAKATTTWRKYISLIERVYPKFGETIQLPLDDDE